MQGQPGQAPARPDAPVLGVPRQGQHLQPQAGKVAPGHRPAQGHRHLVHGPPAVNTHTHTHQGWHMSPLSPECPLAPQRRGGDDSPGVEVEEVVDELDVGGVKAIVGDLQEEIGELGVGGNGGGWGSGVCVRLSPWGRGGSRRAGGH